MGSFVNAAKRNRYILSLSLVTACYCPLEHAQIPGTETNTHLKVSPADSLAPKMRDHTGEEELQEDKGQEATRIGLQVLLEADRSGRT